MGEHSRLHHDHRLLHCLNKIEAAQRANLAGTCAAISPFLS
jgi:hypothetical protein